MDTIINKLKLSSGRKILILDLPEEFNIDVAHDSKITGNRYGFVLTFTSNKAEVDTKVLPVVKAAAADAVIWIAYPKRTTKLNIDLSRDNGWEPLDVLGYRPVSQVSLNDTWSALRFKPFEQIKSAHHAKKQIFEAVIQAASDKSGGAWIDIPFDMQVVYGTTGQVKVKATFDGCAYTGSIANMGSGHILLVRKDIREKIGKTSGDKVKVTIEEDKAERIVDTPEKLKELLRQHPKAGEFYNSLSYTNRKEYALWISSAKRPETMIKRLNDTLEKLNSGIKNPFTK